MDAEDKQELAEKFIIPMLNVLTQHSQKLAEIEASLYTLRRAVAQVYPEPDAVLAKIEDADQKARKIALELNKLPQLDAVRQMVMAGKDPKKVDA